MQTTPLDTTELGALLGASVAPRASGLHMSDIYEDLYRDLEPGRYATKEGEAPYPLHLAAALGFTFEELLEQGLKARLGGLLGSRPEPQTTVEGVTFSPDLLLQDERGPLLGEIKLKWMSSRHMPTQPGQSFPKEFAKHLTQIKAYCYHLGLLRARLYVFFVNGDYAPPRPKFMGWDLDFTPEELAETWAMLKSHARHKRMMK